MRRNHLLVHLGVFFAAGAAATSCVQWITVCTPPRCEASESQLVQRAIGLGTKTGRVVDVVEGESMGGRRALKLSIVRDHLSSSKSCDVVVFADATDVVAGTGHADAVIAAIDELTAGRQDALVVAGEAACWNGKTCSRRDAESFLNVVSGGQTPRLNMSFVNSGQYAGSREALLAFLDFATDAARDLPRFVDDQGLLVAYAAKYPHRVKIDDTGLLFASMKRWFKLDDEKDDDDYRHAATKTPPPAAAREQSFGVVSDSRCVERAVARRDSSLFVSNWLHPPCYGMRLLNKPKRFATGLGRHCVVGDDDAANHSFALQHFSWCQEEDEDVYDLVYDAGRGVSIRPLLGWHGNGYASHALIAALLPRIPSRR